MHCLAPSGSSDDSYHCKVDPPLGTTVLWTELLGPAIKQMWISGTPEESIDPLTTCLNHLKAVCKQNALEKSSVVTAPSPRWPAASDSKLHSLMCIAPPPLPQPLSVLVNSLGTGW